MEDKWSKPHEYRVIDEMNRKHSINLINPHPSANRLFQVVEYGDNDLRDELAELGAGELVELKLEQVGKQPNMWRACRPRRRQNLNSKSNRWRPSTASKTTK
jgi:hypothetical protein